MLLKLIIYVLEAQFMNLCKGGDPQPGQQSRPMWGRTAGGGVTAGRGEGQQEVGWWGV